MADQLKRVINGSTKRDATKMIGDSKAETARAFSVPKEQMVRPDVERSKGSTDGKSTQRAAHLKTSPGQAAKRADAGEASPVVYIQYMGGERKVDDLLVSAKAAFTHEHPRTKVADLRLYIKPEDRAAYYVINEKFAGRVDF